MDISTVSHHGSHSPVNIRKHHGSYSPSLARKLNQAALSPGIYSKSAPQHVHSSSPNCGHGFFSLFKKSKKKGSFSYGEMEESPSNSPVIERRQKTTTGTSTDDNHHDSVSDTEHVDNTPQFHIESSSDEDEHDEEKELAKGEITLFAVPKVVFEPPPPDLVPILKIKHKFTCDSGKEEINQSEKLEENVPEKEEQLHLQCIEEHVETNEDTDKTKTENGKSASLNEDKHLLEDDIWQKAEDLPVLKKKKVTWDPDVKDPKPRKDSYTAYIEGWHREFLRQQRERRYKYQQMQRKQYEREKYNSYQRPSYGAHSIYPTVVPYF